MIRRCRFAVSGIVQGVGFRPFLHRLARAHELTGFARNTGHGVEGEVEGEAADVCAFLAALGDARSLPPLSVVTEMTQADVPPRGGEAGFAIEESRASGAMTLVSPDVATCPDCLRELSDPQNRRYRYPFINCTNCGPRFTIVRSVPYDRARTTMARFPLCKACAAEYANIEDRRYHAQPDCCAACGPQLTLLSASGTPIPGDPIKGAQALIRRGGILAVKGLGGFHLACLTDEAAVDRLRARKRREEKPLAILCRDAEAAAHFGPISQEEAALLSGIRKPIVLLTKRAPDAHMHLSDNGSIGVMLPYTPVHALLMEGFDALVMTSANASDLPAVIDNDEALRQLAGIADGFLLHDRDIECRCDDSLLRVVDGAPYFIRRSRGYAPQPLAMDRDVGGILALGAEQKASFALGKGKLAFYSQHIGDLKNAETLAHYEAQIARFEALFGVSPARLACDLHPDYLSTRYAAARGLPVIPVQHHHAHMAACMADNRLSGDVIGVIWDGTGLGEDGTIWGGEFLAGGYGGARRMASLRPIRLPGGDAAIRQIGRIADSLRYDCGLLCRDALTRAMLQKDVSCPPSSGMGRLFDGVYALLTDRGSVSYEGQGAVLLEALAECAKDEAGRYPFAFYEAGGVQRIDTRGMVRGILRDLEAGEAPARIAMRFHNTLVEMAAAACLGIREVTGLSRIVLSGGVFFNQILLRALTKRLTDEGFAVFRHRRVSTGDEGIALGQMAVAASQ